MGLFPGAKKLAAWMYDRQLQREAEMEIMEDIAWARARQNAADRMLRREGEQP